jgi:hypothetical protein
MRIAAFDFGSNALKCLVCETEGQDYSILAEGRISTRLGSAITPTGTLPEESIIQTLESCQATPGRVFANPRGFRLYPAAGTQAFTPMPKMQQTCAPVCFQQTGIQLRSFLPKPRPGLPAGAMQHQKGILALIDSGGPAQKSFLVQTAESPRSSASPGSGKSY